MLAGRYRALDLTDITGAFCGKMLADLGVDVIKVEPPGGSSERDLGPFFHDEPHREKGLYWFAYNVNKRGITLDLETADGRDLFRRLVPRVDFVVESFAPGYLDDLGIGYQALAALNPRLILTSITPFGQSGPYVRYPATDLTIIALGGLLNMNGDADRAPLRFMMEQSFPQAGAQAAAATMIAHHYRATSGRGQHIDVSMQEAISLTPWLQQHFWDIARVTNGREGATNRRAKVLMRIVFPCKDGYISWRIFVTTLGPKTKALVDWMAEEGMAGPSLVDVDWQALVMEDLEQDEVDRWEQTFTEFFMKHTKATLHHEALKRGIMLFPMNDARDLLDEQQLAARGYWQRVEHPELGVTLPYPGHPYHSTAYQPGPAHRAPLLGEHNRDVYCGELGLSTGDLTLLKQAGVI